MQRALTTQHQRRAVYASFNDKLRELNGDTNDTALNNSKVSMPCVCVCASY